MQLALKASLNDMAKENKRWLVLNNFTSGNIVIYFKNNTLKI